MSGLPRLVLSILPGALLALAQPSGAQAPERLSLQWTAPASCPSASYVRSRIQRTIGAADARHQPVEADARVHQGEDGMWTVTLRTKQDKRTGERTFEAATCMELADATALIVAMMIVREPTPDAPEQPPPPPVAVQPVRPRPRPRPRVTPPPRVAAPPRERMSFVLAPLLALDAGSLPSTALGFGLVAGIARETARVELGGMLWPARQATAADRSSAGSNVALTLGSLQGCVRPLAGAARIDGCGGLELGQLRAEGFGVAHTQREGALWSAFVAGAVLTWPVGELALRLQVGAAVPFTRASVVLQPYGEVFRPSAVAPRGAVGISWNIP